MPLGAAQTQHDPRAQLGRLFLFCRAEKPTEFAERRSRRILACVGSRVDVGAGVALHDVGVMPNQRAGSKGASLVCGGFLNHDIRVTSTCSSLSCGADMRSYHVSVTHPFCSVRPRGAIP